MLQASWVAQKQSGTSGQQPTPRHPVVTILAKPSRSIPPVPSHFVGSSPLFPPGTIALGLNHPGFYPPVHYLALQIHFLFSPPGIFSIPIMASLSLPNMTLGILFWYIDPPTSTPPGQLRPYHVLALVQLVPTTPAATPIPPQP